MIRVLKFMNMRIKEQKKLNENNLFLYKYITTYNLAKKISEYIKTNYDIQLTDGEISYLTIHIQNIINSNKYGK